MRRRYIPKQEHREALDRNVALREELEATKKELETLEGRYRVAIADVRNQRAGKVAKTLAIAEHMLSDCIRLSHELEENKSTKPAARRLRSILGLTYPKQEGEESEPLELAQDSIDHRDEGALLHSQAREIVGLRKTLADNGVEACFSCGLVLVRCFCAGGERNPHVKGSM